MRTETRTIMVPNSQRVYIANDGTEFSRYIECVNHELDAYRKWIEQSNDVIECKELLDCPPFDGEEYSPENTYRWIKPLNENGIELLNTAFPAEWETNDLSNCDIGEWHCVGYNPDEYGCYWYALSESRAYVNRILSLLDAIDKEGNR